MWVRALLCCRKGWLLAPSNPMAAPHCGWVHLLTAEAMLWHCLPPFGHATRIQTLLLLLLEKHRQGGVLLQSDSSPTCPSNN